MFDTIKTELDHLNLNRAIDIIQLAMYSFFFFICELCASNTIILLFELYLQL